MPNVDMSPRVCIYNYNSVVLQHSAGGETENNVEYRYITTVVAHNPRTYGVMSFVDTFRRCFKTHK